VSARRRDARRGLSTWRGFIVIDYLSRANEAIADLLGWVLGGDLKYAVDVVEGLDNAPAALDRLFTGANDGMVMVRV